MQKILYTVLFNFFLLSLSGQNIHQIKSFADSQNKNKNYELALKEYQRVFLFDKNQEFNDIFTKIAKIFYHKQDYNQAIKYYNLAWQSEDNDSIKNELVYRKVMCNLRNENYLAGLNELYDIPDNNSKYFQNKSTLYEGICHFGLDDYNASLIQFSELVDSTGVNSLNYTFVNLKKFNKKYNPNRIETMSRIIPGLGQLYVGDWGNAINSIALLGLVAYYASYTVLNYSFFDGVLVLLSWFNRYYTGGAEKAGIIAKEIVEKNKAHSYSQILDIIEKHQKE